MGKPDPSCLMVAAALVVLGCRANTEPSSGPGSVLWQAVDSSMAAPAVADSTVYFGTLDHAAVALDVRTGAVRWRSSTGETLGENPGRNVLVVGGLLVVPDIGIHAFDRTTGASRWHFHPASGDQPGRFAIATDGTTIFAGSAAGFAYAINASTGTPVWSDVLAVDD